MKTRSYLKFTFVLAIALAFLPESLAHAQPSLPFSRSFNSGTGGFTYEDDTFRGSNQPAYASGTYLADGGFNGGGLQVLVGGINGADIADMSGGWKRNFTVATTSEVTLNFRYNLTQKPGYEPDEFSQVLVSIDGVLRGLGGNDYVDQLIGDGDGGGQKTTGWQQVDVSLGVLTPGTHEIIIGGYNNLKTTKNEFTTILFDDVAISASGPPVNAAPTVDAGANNTITLPNSANLNATVSDDGLPNPPSSLTYQWTKISGPGTVTFGNANAEDTTASFSQAGTYVLQLNVDDSELDTDDTVTITVNPEPVNQAPNVDAGANDTITLPSVANLDATVSDDGLPNPPASLTYLWTKVSGPGTVTFGNANAEDTTASFSQAGTYVLQLNADDSELNTNDTVTITVNPQPVNTAPSVNAGANQTITLPSSANLNATVTDDGLPNPPGALTYQWIKVSGPGTVTFGSATSEDTSASFSSAGTYVLRLTADDSALNASDEITITVNPQPINGPIAHWRFDESAGTNAADSAGNGNNGTLINMTNADWVAGQINNGLDFDGSNDFVAIQNLKYDTAGSIAAVTVCSWINTSNFNRGTIIDFDRSEYWSLNINFHGNGNHNGRLTWATKANNIDDMVSTQRVDDGQWHHVCGVYDSSITNDKKIYIDGALNAQKDEYATGVGLGTGTTRYGFIGDGSEASAFNGGRNNRFYRGLLDDVRIYDRALSASEIQAVYDEGTGPPVNQAPSVDAGADDTITLPSVANLEATVSDDGLPNPPSSLTYQWTKISGPGTVTFGNANAEDTTASFSQAGTYVLQLNVDDSELDTDDTVTITVNPEPVNQAPNVDAGADDTITLPSVANLEATVSDDGLPNPPASLTYLWTKVSGPGTVTFGNANAEDTTASFSQAGTYVLQLNVDDSELDTDDTVTITVNPEPVNQAPNVDAGANQSITLPSVANLNATVTDDGLPNPPGALTYQWIKVSGPGTVTFGSATSEDTSASFSLAGTYVLRLTADDSALNASDEITITVNPQPINGPIAHWRFDESAGTSAADSSGNGNTGTLINMTNADWVAGQINNGLDFDGSNDFVAIQNLTYQGAGSISAVTSCAWINTTNFDRGTIIDFDRSEYWSLAINFHGNGSHNGRVSWDTRANSTHDMVSTQRVDDGQWHHVCGVYDSTITNDKKIYVDGVLNAQADAYATGVGLGRNSTVRYGFIGDGSEANAFNGGRNSRYFRGKLDDIRIYDRALNATEILAVYNEGSGPPNVAPVFNVTGTQTTSETVLLEFTISATDANPGDTLTYNSGPLPAGANFDANTQTFSWTPTEGQAGNYSVDFTVTDSGNLTDNLTVDIVVDAVVSGPTNVSGDISTDTTWTLTRSPYIVTGDITVSTNTTLTIEPGVEVKFDGDYELDIDGILDAQGTSQNMILFTSNQTTPSTGDWQNLEFSQSSANNSQLSNCVIEYANFGIAIFGASPSIDSCTVQNNTRGIYETTGASASITNNNIIDNEYGIYVSGNVDSIHNFNTINNNVVSNFYISSGSERSINAENNWWGTIDPISIMNTIRDQLDTSNVDSSVDFVPFLDAPGGSSIGHEYLQGIIDEDTTWTTLHSPYIVLEDILIKAGSKVTIDPGVEIRFDGYYWLLVDGALDAQGTQQDMITFTSNQVLPEAGDWNKIYFSNISIGNVIKYANISYANFGVHLFSSSPIIENNNFQFNSTAAYVERVSSTNFLNNIIENNTSRGLFIRGGSLDNFTGLINGNSFVNNNGSDIVTTGSFGQVSDKIINAESNWWGTVDATEIVNRITDFSNGNDNPTVDFTPFLDAPNGNPIGHEFYHGAITTDTTWLLQDSPFFVVEDIEILEDSMLTIEPGVEVKFMGYHRLKVSGVLDAQGTQTNKIKFTSNQPVPAANDWRGLEIDGAIASDSIIKHAIIEYSLYTHIQNSSPMIEDSLIQFNEQGLFIRFDSSPMVLNNVITNNTEYGVFLNTSSAFTGSGPKINFNSLFDNTDYDIYASGSTEPITIDAQNNWWNTTDPAVIETLIFDSNDNSGIQTTVLFEPFLYAENGTAIITDVSASPIFITPQNSETVSINYTLSDAADVTIKIYDFLTDQLVRTLTNLAPRLAGLNNEIWDGKGDGNLDLPVGSYYYIIDAVTALSEQGRYEPAYVPGIVQAINTSLTPVSFDPYKGEKATIDFDLVLPAFVTLRAGIEFAGSADRVITDDQPFNTSNNSLIWDGRDDAGNFVIGDTYVVYADTKLFPDNLLVLQDPPFNAIDSVASSPYSIYACYGESTTIEYILLEDANVTLEIINPTGTVVKTFFTNELKTGGTFTESWDGRNDSGDVVADPGDYKIRITAVHPITGVTQIRQGNVTVFR